MAMRNQIKGPNPSKDEQKVMNSMTSIPTSKPKQLKLTETKLIGKD